MNEYRITTLIINQKQMNYDVELGLRNRGYPNRRTQNDSYARRFNQNRKVGKRASQKRLGVTNN